MFLHSKDASSHILDYSGLSTTVVVTVPAVSKLGYIEEVAVMASYNNINNDIDTALKAAEEQGYQDAMMQALFWVCQRSEHKGVEYDKYSDWGATFEAAINDLLNK